MSEPTSDDYALQGKAVMKTGPAPDLPYRPAVPQGAPSPIGLIGCGGITELHLSAYREYGWDVVAMMDIVEDAAIKRRDTFYPEAEVYTDVEALLERDDIKVVDIALHPEPRASVIEQSLHAGKHVLSQKPFAIDLDTADRLVAMAEDKGLCLAVNQNGRFAPHVAYTRAAIDAGLLGQVGSIDLSVHWDHNWTAGTPFDRIPHLLFYDFAIHWFDMVNCYLAGRRIKQVSAKVIGLAGQRSKPPLGGHAILEADDAIATLSFNGNTLNGSFDRSLIVGSEATIHSSGPNLNEQELMLYKDDAQLKAELTGRWFNDGFAGAMGELLCAVEDNRKPSHSASHNLHSLEIAFAAIASAQAGGKPIQVGSVRQLDRAWIKPQ